MAIEPSPQFRNQTIEDRLKLAQINKLESEPSKLENDQPTLLRKFKTSNDVCSITHYSARSKSPQLTNQACRVDLIFPTHP